MLEHARYAMDMEWSIAESSTGFPIAFSLIDMHTNTAWYARLHLDPWDGSEWTKQRVIAQWKSEDSIISALHSHPEMHSILESTPELVIVSESANKEFLQSQYPNLKCKVWTSDFSLNDVQQFRAQLMLTNWMDTQGDYHALKDAQGIAFSYTNIQKRPH